MSQLPLDWNVTTQGDAEAALRMKVHGSAPHQEFQPAPEPKPTAAHSADPAGSEVASGTAAPRKLIIHYHLFKNAGTSVDGMLKANFGDRWVLQEFARGGRAGNSEAVEAFIRLHSDMAVLSSHTAQLPFPQIAGLMVFPIVFLRHPIDRIRSAYAFERKQRAETFGARLAKETDFGGYVRALLDRGSGQVCNFHVDFLKRGQEEGTSALERAKRTLMALPFVGIVEQYAESVVRLERWLQPHFPDFAGSLIHLNATQPAQRGLAAKLAAVRDEIGPEIYGELLAANAEDMELFDGFIAANQTAAREPAASR